MKKLTLLLMLVPSIAYADSAGASLEILPSGTLTVDIPPLGSASGDAKTAIGFGVFADHAIDPLISIGFAPRFFFGVNGTNSNDKSAEELDLRLRGTVGKEVAPKIRPYFYLTPGYSILFYTDANGNGSHPHGFAIGLGGGVSYQVTPTASGFFELGYQWGFQGGTASGGGFSTDYKFETDYFGIAIGASTEVMQ